MSAWAWVLANLAVLLGAALHGSVGFGVNLVVVPVLLMLDPKLVPGPVLVVATVLTVLISLRERGAIHRGELMRLIGGAVPGLVAGAIVLRMISERGLAIMIGVFVLAAVVLSALGWRPKTGAKTTVVAGAVAGFMGTTAAIPGPPVALAYQGRDGAAIRGMLGAFLVFLNPVALATLAMVGEFGRTQMVAGLGLVPGVVVGFLVSSRTRHYLKGRRMRWAVLAVSAAAAVAVLVQALG
ncbi:MAG TPA: sulfite exporter TauE/SafE family protein [Longimicrobiales bacterium]|nr:sulfite exporter TauE/SafE family protein [Longimicrobiales bacterium]